MSKVTMTAAQINELHPLQIATNEAVRAQFINIYGAIHSEKDAVAAYERESLYFNRIMRESDKLLACTPISVYIAFIDLAVNGLSLEPGVRALAYLQPRGYKTGQKTKEGKDIYEQRCTLTISGYGELVQRIRAGQILYADNPTIVYEGDGFSVFDRGGRKQVDYELNMSHDTSRPIACYINITRADGSKDAGVLLPNDWKRLEGFSEKANSYTDRSGNYVRRVNPLYSSGEGNRIDDGFLIAKCIKHAFKTYPKVRVGRGTVYQADINPTDDEDYYNLSAVTETARPEPKSFAEPSPQPAGITVDPEQSDDNDGTW